MTEVVAQRIARNTAWITVGSILQKLISFAYFTIIAIVLGVTGTGRFFFALTYVALFAVLMDFGVSPVLTREVARDRPNGLALVLPALLFRLLCILGTAALMQAVAAIIGYPAEARVMIAIATAAVALDACSTACEALLRGVQRVHYEAIGIVANQVALTVSGIVILIAVAGLHTTSDASGTPLAITRAVHGSWLLLPYVIASVVRLVIAVWGCTRERLLALRGAVDRAAFPWLIRTATPFLLTAGLARLYTYLDTFLLSVLSTELAVGYYATPFKIAFAFQFIPLAFMGALYPAMSAVARAEPPRLPALFEQAIRALLTVAVPIAVGIGVLAERILVSIYGSAFLPSAVPLVLLVASLPFVFVNFPAGYLLNAVDRQVTNTILVGIVTAVNAALNLALIPPYGAVGAATSALVGSAVLTALNLIAVHRVVAFRWTAIVSVVARLGIAGLTMGVAVRAVAAFPLIMTIILGAVAFLVAAWVVRAVTVDDVRRILGYFRRRRATV